MAFTDRGNGVIEAAAIILAAEGVSYAFADDVSGKAVDAVRVLVAGGVTPVTEEMIERFPRLMLVVRTGAGYEHVALDALERRGVGLVAPRLGTDTSIAEYVVGASIYLSRGLSEADRAARAGDYQHRFRSLSWGLSGRRLGIVGMGRVGRQVAAIAPSLGMDVSAWHPWSERSLDVKRYNDFHGFLANSDVVTLHCRLTKDTHHLVDAAALRAMDPETILVNTARGAIVNEDHLAEALRAGTLAAAAIDTFANEFEIASSPLQDAPHTLLTPHLAGLTRQSVQQLAEFVGGAVRTFLLSGDTPHGHIVLAPQGKAPFA